MSPVETYLRELGAIRASGAGMPETSYYGALENLLNAVGRTLRPQVRCVMQLRNRGAGHPDGGLFTPDQFDHQAGDAPRDPANPARGVIEIKPFADDTWLTVRGSQVTRYFGTYRQVLVTNYRDFVLVGEDARGDPAALETIRLADDEAGFLAALADPARTAALLGTQLLEYLKRVLTRAAPVAAPQDLAWLLASYARDALARVEKAEVPALDAVRTALEGAVGIRFEGPRGEHFFRSSLVQTIFYGIFSAWVLWSREGAAPGRRDAFEWRMAQWSLRVPLIAVLFEQLSMPSRLHALDLVEVLDWTNAAFNRVDRAAFFARFSDDDAVQYFYEPFLEAFDPDLRKQLGVWYTPREIIRYMVARVDTVLREELGVEEGLADSRVYVLDPCCGTGAYLVEVLRHIHGTLAASNGGALGGADLRDAARSRIHGFELLPAPFVIAHLQVGMLLAALGVPFSERAGERAGIYLTNALTGWDPAAAPSTLGFPEFQQERDAARHVKQEAPILVILGNPPYNGYAGVAMGAVTESIGLPRLEA